MLYTAGLYLLTLLLYSVVAFLTGQLLFHTLFARIRVDGLYSRFFIYSLAGTIMWVCVTALVAARGLTSQLLWLLPAVYLLRHPPVRLKLPVSSLSGQPAIKQSYTILFLFLLLSSGIYVWLFLRQGPVTFRPLHDDLLVYAGLSQQLSECGSENRWIHLLHLSCEGQGTEPYHYFELWLNALFSLLPGLNSATALVLVTYPYFLFLSFTAVLALMEYFRPGLRFQLLSPFIFLVLAASLPFFFSQQGIYTAEGPLGVFGEKTVVLYPFVCLSFLLSQRGNRKEALLSLFFLCLCSIATYPAMCVFMLLSAVALRERTLFPQVLIAIVALPVFYLMAQLISPGMLSTQLSAWQGSLNWKGELLEALRIGQDTLSAFVINNWFYVILTIPAFFTGSKLLRFTLVIIGLTYLSALLAAIVLKHVTDAHQFFTAPMVLTRVAALLLLLEFINNLKNSVLWKRTIALLLLSLCLLSARHVWHSQRAMQSLQTDNEDFNLGLARLAVDYNEGEEFAVLPPLPFPSDILRTRGYSALWPFAVNGFKPVPLMLGESGQPDKPDQVFLRNKTPWHQPKEAGLSDSLVITELLRLWHPRLILATANNPLLKHLIPVYFRALPGPAKGSILLVAQRP